jgi:hypothetical protein
MIRRGSSRLCCVVPGCCWWWFSESSLGGFLGVFSGPCSWGFDGGNMWEPFVVLLILIPLPNPWVKGLDFGVFGVLGLEEFLAGFLWFLLIWQVLVGLNLPMDSSWGVPNIPQVLFKSVERFGRSRLGFGGVDPRVLFIPRSPGHTSLTGASHRSNRWRPLLEFCSGEHLGAFTVVLCCCCFEFGSVWSSVGLFGVLGLSGWDWSDRCVAPAWPVWSHSMEVARFHQKGPVWPVVLTGLTGVGQWNRVLVFRYVLGSVRLGVGS